MADEEEWDVEVEETEAAVQKLSLGDDEEDSAVAEAQAAVAANPGSAAAHQALGQALLNSGDDEAAVAAFKEAAKLENTAGNQYRLGLALKAGDQNEAARAAFKAAVELDGNHAGALVALGGYELDADQKENADAALDLFRRAAAADASNADAHRQAGQILLGRGGAEDAKEAAAFFARVAELDAKDGNARAALIQAYDRVGADADRDAARAALRADAEAGKINAAFVAFDRVLISQFEVGDKLVQAFEHFKGDNRFTFQFYKKGEVHDTKILQTLAVAEADYAAAKAQAQAQA